MNDVVQFSFEGSGVRVIERDGEPWFVAKDVADLLGYANSRQAVSVHCKASDTWRLDTGPQARTVTIIPERDVYRLIMRSKLTNAEQFEEWVVGTVLPSIRKHGGYIAQQETLSPEEIIAKALVVAQKVIDEKAARIAHLEPIAAVADASH